MEMDVSLIIVKDNKKLSLKGLTENKMQKVKLKTISFVLKLATSKSRSVKCEK
jgi:hypothetical protein